MFLLQTFLFNSQAPTSLLFVAGADDKICNAVGHARLAEQIMLNNGKTNFEILPLPGSGHFIDLPYSPVTRSVLFSTS